MHWRKYYKLILVLHWISKGCNHVELLDHIYYHTMSMLISLNQTQHSLWIFFMQESTQSHYGWYHGNLIYQFCIPSYRFNHICKASSNLIQICLNNGYLSCSARILIGFENCYQSMHAYLAVHEEFWLLTLLHGTDTNQKGCPWYGSYFLLFGACS